MLHDVHDDGECRDKYGQEGDRKEDEYLSALPVHRVDAELHCY